MRKIVGNYIYNCAYQMFVMLIPLILQPYLARTLGANNLGVYSYVYSVCTIISVVSMLGTYNYGVRQTAYYRDDSTQSRKFYWELFWLRLILGTFGIFIYITIAFLSEYTMYFILFAGWLIAAILDPSWLFVGMEDMKPTVIKNFAVKVFSVILIFIFVKTSDDLWKYSLIMGASVLISTFILLLQAKIYVGTKCGSLNNIKKHISGSVHLFLPQAASLFYLQIDKVMLKMLTGDASQVSFYDQAEKIVTVPLTFITVLSTVMMPRLANDFAHGKSENLKRSIDTVGRFSIMFAIPMFIGIAAIAGDLIPWYLGEEYIPSVSAIILISPIIVTNSLSGISGNQYFTATNQTNILLKAYVSAAICNIIANALLIPNYKFMGAAAATVLSSAVSVIIQYHYMDKQINIKNFIGYCIKYSISSIPMLLIVIFVGQRLPSTPTTTLIQVICGVLAYFAMLTSYQDKLFIQLTKKITNIIKINKAYKTTG